MSKSSNCQNDNYSSESNSGFIFGLICGAIIGAIIAVIIYKNNKSEVFEKLEQKIKSFFEGLIPKSKISVSTKTQKKSAKIIAVEPTVQPKQITPVFVKAKKPTPKMFVKPKK